jgi:hypothetical protein
MRRGIQRTQRQRGDIKRRFVTTTADVRRTPRKRVGRHNQPTDASAQTVWRVSQLWLCKRGHSTPSARAPAWCAKTCWDKRNKRVQSVDADREAAKHTVPAHRLYQLALVHVPSRGRAVRRTIRLDQRGCSSQCKSVNASVQQVLMQCTPVPRQIGQDKTAAKHRAAHGTDRRCSRNTVVGSASVLVRL